MPLTPDQREELRDLLINQDTNAGYIQYTDSGVFPTDKAIDELEAFFTNVKEFL